MAIYTSILTAGTNSHAETSENVNGIATDFVSQGVIGAITNTAGVAPTTGAFGVNAQGTPNMTVAVNSGVAYVTATPASQDSQTLRVRSTTTQTVTISANTSGATKYDWLYISIDPSKAANPAVDASDVATLVTSRSSLSTSDNGTPPAYGYCIAVITVSNGASSITNSNITDKRADAPLSQPSLITYTNLLSTIFSGQVQSYTNSGTLGGTFYYINLGGIKLLWGTSSNVANSTSPTQYGLTLPTSFFTTIQSATATTTGMTTETRQYVSIASQTTSSILVWLYSYSNSCTTAVTFWVIGT